MKHRIGKHLERARIRREGWNAAGTEPFIAVPNPYTRPWKQRAWLGGFLSRCQYNRRPWWLRPKEAT